MLVFLGFWGLGGVLELRGLGFGVLRFSGLGLGRPVGSMVSVWGSRVGFRA